MDMHSKIDQLLILEYLSLQIQRNLQLRIEEQGKHLQMMFEQQRKMEEEKRKASSSNSDRPQSPSIEKQPSFGNDKPESSDNDDAATKEFATDVCVSADEPSERKPSDDQAPFTPPTKRAKVNEMSELGVSHE